jgi:hypothetical protein
MAMCPMPSEADVPPPDDSAEPEAEMKLKSVMLIRWPGAATSCHGHEAEPT